MVDIALRFMIEQVGQVEGVYPTEDDLANNFLMRRTAGHGIELVGILAFRASPVWIMAALADISGAGRQIVQEMADALKQEGLLEGDAKFENIDQVLDGLEQTAGRAALVFNAPPLDVAGLRQEWEAFRLSASKIPPRNLPSRGVGAPPLGRVEGRSRPAGPERVRAVIAGGAGCGVARARRTCCGWPAPPIARFGAPGRSWPAVCWIITARRIEEIRTRGFATYWAEEFRPYLRAAAGQFSPKRRAMTDKWLR